MKNKIYIAGPLFTEGERWLLERIDEVCRRAGYETYLPHRDAGLFDRSSDESSKGISNADSIGIDSCGLVVEVLNGAEVDPGTADDAAEAHIKGKKIIGYLNDTRIYHPEKQINPRVHSRLERIAGNLEELEKILAEYKFR